MRLVALQLWYYIQKMLSATASDCCLPAVLSLGLSFCAGAADLAADLVGKDLAAGSTAETQWYVNKAAKYAIGAALNANIFSSCLLPGQTLFFVLAGAGAGFTGAARLLVDCSKTGWAGWEAERSQIYLLLFYFLHVKTWLNLPFFATVFEFCTFRGCRNSFKKTP